MFLHLPSSSRNSSEWPGPGDRLLDRARSAPPLPSPPTAPAIWRSPPRTEPHELGHLILVYGARCKPLGGFGKVRGDVVLLVVPGPAEWRAVVVRVSDRGVGAEVDECSDEVEVAVECGFVEGCAAVGGVEVEADVDEEADGVDAMELDGAGHQVGAGVDDLGGEGGVVGEELLGLGGVGAHARSSELVDGAEGSGGGAGAFAECGDPGV